MKDQLLYVLCCEDNINSDVQYQNIYQVLFVPLRTTKVSFSHWSLLNGSHMQCFKSINCITNQMG